MLSAHSTAVTAAMRRLSGAAHNQIPLGRAEYVQRNQNICLARRIHIARLRIVFRSGQRHVISSQGLQQPSLIHSLLHLQKDG